MACNDFWILGALIIPIAFVMKMTVHSGGDFYVLSLVLARICMNLSASTGQFILMRSFFMGNILFAGTPLVASVIMMFNVLQRYLPGIGIPNIIMIVVVPFFV